MLDLASGDDIRLHALYLFPLAWVNRRSRGWLPVAITLLGISALQIVTFSLEAGGMASFMTDSLVSLSASWLVVTLAQQPESRKHACFAPQSARDET